MRWLIFALGLALALGGAASIVSGLPYIRMESGWTEVIAGTTALSAGIMTVALAAILSALRRLELRLVQNNLSASQDVQGSQAADPVPSLAVAPNPASEGPDVAILETDVPVLSVVEHASTPPSPSRSLEQRIWSGPNPSGTAANERAAEAVPLESYRPMDRSSGARSAAPAPAREARRWPKPAETDVVPARSYAPPGSASPAPNSADDRIPSLIPSPRPLDAAFTGAVSAVTESPTVVGRYESGGASYVLFSDGTIEVETEMGLHRFGSMEELKAYIDQQGQASLG